MSFKSCKFDLVAGIGDGVECNRRSVGNLVRAAQLQDIANH